MSEFETNSQAVSGLEERSDLTFIQRFLLGMNLWFAYAIVATVLTVDHFSSGSFWRWIIGCGILFATFGISRWVWRFLKRGRFRAGMAVVSFFMFNVGVVTLFSVIVLGVALQDEAFVDKIKTEWRWMTFDPEVALVEDESHLIFGIQSVSGQGSKGGFNECIEELHRGEVNTSMKADAIKILGFTVGESLAEEAVQDVMIKVCLKFEEGKVQVLRPYFFKSINNARADLRKRKVRDRDKYCEFKETRHKKLSDPGITSEEQLQLVQAAMCRIDERQAYVVRKRHDEESYWKIARDLGTSEGNARKLYSLGLQSIRTEIAILSR